MLTKNSIVLETFGNRKLEYFSNLGYDISGDTFEIKIEHLNKGSRKKVEVQCDFCQKKVYISYKEYLRNISIGGKYACCKLCGSKKAEEKSILERGISHHMKLKEVQNKTKNTNLRKYGFEFLMQSEEIKRKSKKTCLEKYGVDHISKSEKIRLNTSLISKDVNYIRYLENNESLLFCETCREEFKIKNDNYFHRKKSNVSLCTICNPIGDSSSIKEKDLFEFISLNYTGEIIKSYREGLEIDIYLPDLNIGFEFNGLYWHSEDFKESNYHLNKTNHFKRKGITIIHIWEDDWTFKRNIIESQIKNLLKVSSEKIFARKCKIRELKSVTDFLNNNHIQGVDKSNIKLGLFYNDELVSVMTFNRIEGRFKMNKDEWNLSRFCSKLNTNVVGGASKLLNYFQKKYEAKRIISYADRDWSLGDLYYKLGFLNINETNPDYKYLVNNRRVNKSRYRKSKLNTTLSESQEMKLRNIQKIWDCGKIKFELKYKN
jgi:hypothetical protein